MGSRARRTAASEIRRRVASLSGLVAVSATSPNSPDGQEPPAPSSPHAPAQLLEAVYRELRELAAQRLSSLSPNDSLQPTELLHEAYLRLVRSGRQEFASRQHFIGASALAMRSILVDRARARLTAKRGGRRARIDIDELPLAVQRSDEDVLEIDEAISRLEQVDARAAQVVILRIYLGLGDNDVAQALGVTDRTVRRDWNFARLWLQRELDRP